jgi:hypothetical protein
VPGLSRDVRVCLLELDGVLTLTPKVHAAVADLGGRLHWP